MRVYSKFLQPLAAFFIWLALFLYGATPLTAEAAAPTDWVLATEAFTFSRKDGAGAEQLTTMLPQLILEQISSGSTRVLPANEVLDRKLYALQTERLSLFLQLSKEYKARDALVVTNISSRRLEKEIAAAQKKIAAIEKQIDENLAQVEKETQAAAPAIEREAAIARGEEVAQREEGGRRFPFQLPFPFFREEDEELRTSEFITLYKNDITALFTPSARALEEGRESYAFQKEVLAAKINALITGTMMVFGDYVSVTVDLHVYPGSRNTGTVTEIGTISDMLSLAERLVRALTPKLSNSLPLMLRVELFPEEAARTAQLTLDGIVFTEIPRELTIDAAIHTISIAAEGYETASITYQFEGRTPYTMRVSLVPEVKGVLSLRLKKFKDGLFYANGLETSPVTEEAPRTAITINGKSVLGLFTTGTGESENSAFFYIPVQRVQDDAALVVKAKTYDRAANIDKRRRRMYTAYTALICSLPFTFYCVGNFTAVNNGYMLRLTTYDDAVAWQNRMYNTLTITAICGAWTVIELIRYLHAANSVLPAQASTDWRAEKEKRED